MMTVFTQHAIKIASQRSISIMFEKKLATPLMF